MPIALRDDSLKLSRDSRTSWITDILWSWWKLDAPISMNVAESDAHIGGFSLDGVITRLQENAKAAARIVIERAPKAERWKGVAGTQDQQEWGVPSCLIYIHTTQLSSAERSGC
jgi:hypothetical protein